MSSLIAGAALAVGVAGVGLSAYEALKPQPGTPGYNSAGNPTVPTSSNYQAAQTAAQQYVPNSSDYAAAQQAMQQYVPNASQYASLQQAMQQYAPTSQQYQAAQGQTFNTSAQQGLNFAQQGTQSNIANQEAVTPGSSAQRALANQQLNSYIQGVVPQDVQQNTQRAIAQSTGGGFNLFSGGGQAPADFARSIGQTSLGLSQYGLSAAPTWQKASLGWWSFGWVGDLVPAGLRARLGGSGRADPFSPADRLPGAVGLLWLAAACRLGCKRRLPARQLV